MEKSLKKKSLSKIKKEKFTKNITQKSSINNLLFGVKKEVTIEKRMKITKNFKLKMKKKLIIMRRII